MDTKNIEAFCAAAIDYHLGDTSGIPESVQYKIYSIYKEFYSAYINIAELKGLPGNPEVDDLIELDSELIEYMRHFFSDYQTVYRDFISLNRQVRELMQIDQQDNPERFMERLNSLIAGSNDDDSDLIFKTMLNSTP